MRPLNALRHGDARNGAVKRIHNVWRGMLKRCHQSAPGTYAHQKYAARGIVVCPQWHKYEVFRDWAYANGYRDDLSIDRIDNDGPYSPDNCRWIPISEQARNRRTTKWVEIGGVRKPLCQWAEEAGLDQILLGYRVRKGWPEHRLLQPARGARELIP